MQVKFIERGGHDEVTLVYEPTMANEPVLPALPEGLRPAIPPPSGAPASASAPRGAAPNAPPAQPPPAPLGAPKPDAELRGLTTLGLVVEGLSPQAAACGLSEGPLESAVAKQLLDGGFKVRRNSDEDTYLYVHLVTTSVSPALCVSRFDTFLYSYTTTTLSYQTTPTLVQVSLLHEGGLTGGPPATHADLVLRNIKQYVDEFITRIHAASR